MAILNNKAKELSSKYIRKSSPDIINTLIKKRGLQAEVNKMDSIRKVILNNNIDQNELTRFRVEVHKLLFTIDEVLTNKY